MTENIVGSAIAVYMPIGIKLVCLYLVSVLVRAIAGWWADSLLINNDYSTEGIESKLKNLKFVSWICWFFDASFMLTITLIFYDAVLYVIS